MQCVKPGQSCRVLNDDHTILCSMENAFEKSAYLREEDYSRMLSSCFNCTMAVTASFSFYFIVLIHRTFANS